MSVAVTELEEEFIQKACFPGLDCEFNATERSIDWITCTHFCRIRDGGGAGRPPIIVKNETYPNKLYITGKGIYGRVRFILDIEKIFSFGDFMSNFPE